MATDINMLLAAIVVSAIALMDDLRSRRIPNGLTFSAATFGLVYHSITGGSTMLSQSAGGMIFGLALFMIPYFMGGMGAGDAKLIGALGAMLGPRAIANISLLTALVGGIYAFGIIFLRRNSKNAVAEGITSLWMLAATKNLSAVSMPCKQGMPRLYYAVAIAAGTVLYTVLVLTGCEMIL
jgi:prepilin peptidase CpaA